MPELRIGELARRTGVSEHVLRAWESRYGLLQPARGPGGFRLYYAADEARVRRMQVHLNAGLSAAQAASATLAEEQSPTVSAPGDRSDELARSLDAMDEHGANQALDRLLADFTVETVLAEVVLPYLADLGRRWEDGKVSIAQEHFASNVLHGRLTGLARGWGSGFPVALLACLPGERHDLGLLVFGIALHRRGWGVRFLGADTPVGQLADLTTSEQPAVIVLAASDPARFDDARRELVELAARVPLVLAGNGATAVDPQVPGARVAAGDPVSAAQALADEPPHPDRARTSATGTAT